VEKKCSRKKGCKLSATGGNNEAKKELVSREKAGDHFPKKAYPWLFLK